MKYISKSINTSSLHQRDDLFWRLQLRESHRDDTNLQSSRACQRSSTYQNHSGFLFILFTNYSLLVHFLWSRKYLTHNYEYKIIVYSSSPIKLEAQIEENYTNTFKEDKYTFRLLSSKLIVNQRSTLM